MSAASVQTLRDRAAKIATQLRDAQTAAEKAQAERIARNDQRIAAYWADATDRCNGARAAATDARRAVVNAAAAGDTTGALAAYSDYVARIAEADVVVRNAQQASRVYSWTERRQVDPEAQVRKVDGSYQIPPTENHDVQVLARVWHRENDMPPATYETKYPAGVEQATDPAEAFDKLLAEGLARFTESHRAAFSAEYLAPLNDQLEPEDDE